MPRKQTTEKKTAPVKNTKGKGEGMEFKVKATPKAERNETKDGNFTRQTVVIRKEYLTILKVIAALDNREVKEVLDEALTEYLKPRRKGLEDKIPEI